MEEMDLVLASLHFEPDLSIKHVYSGVRDLLQTVPKQSLAVQSIVNFTFRVISCRLLSAPL
jgi:hypothetical protein